MVQPNWNGLVLTPLGRNLPSKLSQNLMEDTQEESQNTTACSLPLLLVSDSSILLTWNALHMTGHCNKTTDQAHSPFKTMLRKIGDRYQSYCTTYKTHAMTTHYRGVGHTGKDTDLNSHVERHWKLRWQWKHQQLRNYNSSWRIRDR